MNYKVLFFVSLGLMLILITTVFILGFKYKKLVLIANNVEEYKRSEEITKEKLDFVLNENANLKRDIELKIKEIKDRDNDKKLEVLLSSKEEIEKQIEETNALLKTKIENITGPDSDVTDWLKAIISER